MKILPWNANSTDKVFWFKGGSDKFESQQLHGEDLTTVSCSYSKNSA